MDRIVHYSIRDILSVDDNLSIDLRITTIGFPVDETLEYQSSGKWFEDISTISRTYIGTDKEEYWNISSLDCYHFLMMVICA